MFKFKAVINFNNRIYGNNTIYKYTCSKKRFWQCLDSIIENKSYLQSYNLIANKTAEEELILDTSLPYYKIPQVKLYCCIATMGNETVVNLCPKGNIFTTLTTLGIVVFLIAKSIIMLIQLHYSEFLATGFSSVLLVFVYIKLTRFLAYNLKDKYYNFIHLQILNKLPINHLNNIQEIS